MPHIRKLNLLDYQRIKQYPVIRLFSVFIDVKQMAHTTGCVFHQIFFVNLVVTAGLIWWSARVTIFLPPWILPSKLTVLRTVVIATLSEFPNY